MCNDPYNSSTAFPLRDSVTATPSALNRESEGSNPSPVTTFVSPTVWRDIQNQFDIWNLIRWEPPTGLTFKQVSRLLTVEQAAAYRVQFVDEPSLVSGSGEHLFDHRTVKAFLLWWDKNHPADVA